MSPATGMGPTPMPKLRVSALSVSLDGYAAGPRQSTDDPLGVGGEQLHTWMFDTRSVRAAHGSSGGATGVDDDWVARSGTGIGATIMGRNMFGPVRGGWTQPAWTGWWGEDPPFHHPVFVLTHHPRPPVQMAGGTTFTFVPDGITSALAQAFAAAGGADVRLGGGPSTIRQYLRAGLVDELHVAVVPVLLGSGERLLGDLDDAPPLTCTEYEASPTVVHYRLVRVSS
jgi:dihydrofolate reductase